MKQFIGATTNKFRLKVPKLQPKAALNSPLKELEEGAFSALYLLVVAQIETKKDVRVSPCLAINILRILETHAH
jgi:hypothetical protein